MKTFTPADPYTEKRTRTPQVTSGGRCDGCQRRRELIDVLIIGAGAAGIAVALAVLEKVRGGWPIDSLTMIERSGERGRGAAYTSAMNGTVCNRRDDEMSLMYGQPDHFKEWARSHPRRKMTGGDHSERQVYGDYLEHMLRQVNATAFDQMVDFRLVRREAVDMDRYVDGDATIYGVRLDDGCSVFARNVVLALGNFAQTPELSGTLGYFPSPWPLSKLDEILKFSSIGIVGTGTTAYGALTRLHKRQHKGRLYMMSEDGQLPRLERPRRHFKQVHALHAAVRGLEKRKVSLASLLESIVEMMQEYDKRKDTSVLRAKTSYENHEYHDLLKDMGVLDGDEGRSRVVDVLRPLAERIWTSTPPHERDYLQNHTVWNSLYQPTIPRNLVAMHVQHAVGSKNLEIIRDQGVGSKNGYFLMGQRRRKRVDFVVDAGAPEHRLSAIAAQSPLLREMARKGLATADPAGGLRVGVADHRLATARADEKPAAGLYAVGALTKGAHWFVEDAGCLPAHALRVADGLVGLPRSRPAQVALFVGRDLFSTAVAARVVPALRAAGHMPYVFLLRPAAVDSPARVPAAERLAWYFEHAVVGVLVANMRAHADGSAAAQFAFATEGVDNALGVHVEEVADPNDAAFVAGLQRHNIDLGFVIGAAAPTIESDLRDAFNLFRLRPGFASSHPSSSSYVHSARDIIRAGGDRFGWTLELMKMRGKGIYQDSFFAAKDRSIGRTPCASAATFDCHELAVELVTGTVDKYSRGGLVSGVRRDLSPLFPKKEEPVALVAVTATIDRILNQLATPESEERLIQCIEGDMTKSGVPFDRRELEAWKRARNIIPEAGFI
ncbi:FAD-NAD(P)-binding-domain-containing protein [Hypoxylon sp. FL1284]|nr:FAD-NAD(P)-binding-domain-containing protein [Hypoxylon sp. FL1284]